MLQKLRLQDFRNFDEKLLEFSPKVSVIIGPNASGKTNILEAINLISTGKSFKAGIEEEMISYDKELSRVKARIKNEETVDLELVLTRGVIKRGSMHEKVAR